MSSSLELERVVPPQPATERNFTTHLSYSETFNAIAYPCGKSAFIRGLDNNDDKPPLVVQFTGHANNNVTVVKFSPALGSQYVVSGDSSGKVIVWSWNYIDETKGLIETKIKSEFHLLSGPITDISWDFEARRLCVVGDGKDQFGAFISWDSGNSLGEVTGHSTKVNACDMKQSRPMRAVTVDDNGKVVFYTGPPFKFSTSDQLHHDQGKFIRDVKFQPGEGKMFITVGSDRKINVFDGVSGHFIKSIEDPEEPIHGGLFAIDWLNSDTFVTTSADSVVRVWDLESSKCVEKWNLNPTNVKDIGLQQVGILTVSKDDKIVSLSLNGKLTILQRGQETPYEVIKGHNKGITSLAVNPLVTGSYDGKILDWNPENNIMYQGHNNLIIGINNKRYPQVSSLSWDDTLQINDEIKYKFESQPKIASVNGNGNVGDQEDPLYAVINNSNELIIINSFTAEIINTLGLSAQASCITISKSFIAIGYERTNAIELFKLNDLDQKFTLKSNMRSTPSYLSISPSEKYIAVGDVLGKIILYDIETRDIKTSRWAFHTGKINAISWKPCGTNDEEEDLVATGSLDTHIMVYSVKRPMKTVKYLNAHKDGVTNVMWQDNDHIVSTGNDACIKTWQLHL